MLAARSAAAASLSLWIILLLGCAACARRQRDGPDYGDEDGGGDEDGESWSESVARARCASRCLSLHSVGALGTPLQVRTRRA